MVKAARGIVIVCSELALQQRFSMLWLVHTFAFMLYLGGILKYIVTRPMFEARFNCGVN